MVDKKKDQKDNQDQNQDEYQFVDLDIMEPESSDTEQDSFVADMPTTEPWYNKKENLRYAAIAVVAILAIVVIYKFMGLIFSSPKAQVKAPVPAPIVRPALVPVPVQQLQPVVASPPPPSAVTQKISALEVSQGTIRSDVNNLNNQISTLTTNVNDLSVKIDQLTEAMNTLASQASAQSQQIAQLTARTKPIVRQVVSRGPISAPIHYYIQAVIPGRAWLVSTNGATITVREGTSVPGYGVVKLIDAAQGRVLTSSGRIIAFSQQDT